MAELEFHALHYWICTGCHTKWGSNPWPEPVRGNHEFMPMVAKNGTDYVRHSCRIAVNAPKAGRIEEDVDDYWMASWERR